MDGRTDGRMVGYAKSPSDHGHPRNRHCALGFYAQFYTIHGEGCNEFLGRHKTNQVVYILGGCGNSHI